jgi:hypothetical protein
MNYVRNHRHASEAHSIHGTTERGYAEDVAIHRSNESVTERTFRVSTVLRPGQGCAHCLVMDPPGVWVHLRTNLADGITLCCDNSPHQHSSKHAARTGLPLVTSAEPGEHWVYDYNTDQMLSD